MNPFFTSTVFPVANMYPAPSWLLAKQLERVSMEGMGMFLGFATMMHIIYLLIGSVRII